MKMSKIVLLSTSLRAVSARLRFSADKIDFLSKTMAEKNDASYGEDAICEILTLIGDLRIDEIVSRVFMERGDDKKTPDQNTTNI